MYIPPKYIHLGLKTMGKNAVKLTDYFQQVFLCFVPQMVTNVSEEHAVSIIYSQYADKGPPKHRLVTTYTTT